MLTVAIFAVLGVLAGISPTSAPLAIALGIFAISFVLVQAVVPRLKAREAARRAAMGTRRPRRPQPAPASGVPGDAASVPHGANETDG